MTNAGLSQEAQTLLDGFRSGSISKERWLEMIRTYPEKYLAYSDAMEELKKKGVQVNNTQHKNYDDTSRTEHDAYFEWWDRRKAEIKKQYRADKDILKVQDDWPRLGELAREMLENFAKGLLIPIEIWLDIAYTQGLKGLEAYEEAFDQIHRAMIKGMPTTSTQDDRASSTRTAFNSHEMRAVRQELRENPNRSFSMSTLAKFMLDEFENGHHLMTQKDWLELRNKDVVRCERTNQEIYSDFEGHEKAIFEIDRAIREKSIVLTKKQQDKFNATFGAYEKAEKQYWTKDKQPEIKTEPPQKKEIPVETIKPKQEQTTEAEYITCNECLTKNENSALSLYCKKCGESLSDW